MHQRAEMRFGSRLLALMANGISAACGHDEAGGYSDLRPKPVSLPR
jgi:hypothetical protein